jgi:ComF family protein
MIDTLLNSLAPHHCFECAKIGVLLCSNCKYNIVNEGFSGCIVCARPTGVGICQSCHTTYDKAWCMGDREGVLERLVDAYKFDRVKQASRILAELLDEQLPVLPSATVIVPVPTVRSHIRVRGYDHALLLCKDFAKLRKLHVEPLVGRTVSISQRGLSKKERIKAAKDAFYCNATLDPSVPYLIIDDVVTTNATLRYVAGALKQAGAKMVWVATIARQPLDKQR